MVLNVVHLASNSLFFHLLFEQVVLHTTDFEVTVHIGDGVEVGLTHFLGAARVVA